MEYKLSEQELKDLMHRSWLKAKNFYSGNTDEYFYDYFESEKKQLTIHSVVNCVYVVTERDNYGEQLFKGVFANREKAIEYLAEDGLTESNVDEINEIELD